FTHLFILSCSCPLQVLHSFPTRRSSDLPSVLLSYSSGNYPKSTVSVYPPIFHFSLSDVRRSSLPVSNRNIHSYRRIHDAVEEERSEEHTSELQSRFDLVCRLLLDKNN